MIRRCPNTNPEVVINECLYNRFDYLKNKVEPRKTFRL
jgi:hypothetical protein